MDMATAATTSGLDDKKEEKAEGCETSEEVKNGLQEKEESEETPPQVVNIITLNDIDFIEHDTPPFPGNGSIEHELEDSETVKLLDDHIASIDKLSITDKKKEARLSSLLKQVEEDYPELQTRPREPDKPSPPVTREERRDDVTSFSTKTTHHVVTIEDQIKSLSDIDKDVEKKIESLGFTTGSIQRYRADGSGSEFDRSEAATTDSFEQETDTCDLFQTVGSATPNSQSNAEIFRSIGATIASSQATFISADDVLGSIEAPPTLPNLETTKDLDSTQYGSSQFEEKDALTETEEVASKGENHLEEDQTSEAGGNICLTQMADESTDATILAPVCLYPAQVHQYCPPGLEGLLDCGQLVIHKENLRHNRVFNNNALRKMEVIDISRKVLFYVEEEVPPLTDNSFLFKVYNKDKQEVMQIYNPQSNTCFGCGASWHCLRKCHFQALVFAPLGQVAGFVKRSHTYFVQEFLVMNSQEDVLLIMRGGPDDLEIYTPDLNDELGRLSVHHWHGIMHEVRRSHSDYGITFPIDLDVRVKAVLLGAVFALDWMYSTRGGRVR